MKTIAGFDFLRRKYYQVISAFKTGRKRSSATMARFGETLVNRREILQSLAIVPFIGPSIIHQVSRKGWVSFEEKNLRERLQITVKNSHACTLKEPKMKVPIQKLPVWK